MDNWCFARRVQRSSGQRWRHLLGLRWIFRRRFRLGSHRSKHGLPKITANLHFRWTWRCYRSLTRTGGGSTVNMAQVAPSSTVSLQLTRRLCWSWHFGFFRYFYSKIVLSHIPGQRHAIVTFRCSIFVSFWATWPTLSRLGFYFYANLFHFHSNVFNIFRAGWNEWKFMSIKLLTASGRVNEGRKLLIALTMGDCDSLRLV